MLRITFHTRKYNWQLTIKYQEYQIDTLIFFPKIGLIKTRGFLAKSRSYEEGLVMKKNQLY